VRIKHIVDSPYGRPQGGVVGVVLLGDEVHEGHVAPVGRIAGGRRVGDELREEGGCLRDLVGIRAVEADGSQRDGWRGLRVKPPA
jgi:hypothetical protein